MPFSPSIYGHPFPTCSLFIVSPLKYHLSLRGDLNTIVMLYYLFFQCWNSTTLPHFILFTSLLFHFWSRVLIFASFQLANKQYERIQTGINPQGQQLWERRQEQINWKANKGVIEDSATWKAQNLRFMDRKRLIMRQIMVWWEPFEMFRAWRCQFLS